MNVEFIPKFKHLWVKEVQNIITTFNEELSKKYFN